MLGSWEEAANGSELSLNETTDPSVNEKVVKMAQYLHRSAEQLAISLCDTIPLRKLGALGRNSYVAVRLVP